MGESVSDNSHRVLRFDGVYLLTGVIPDAPQNAVVRRKSGIARRKTLNFDAVPGLHCIILCCNAPGMTGVNKYDGVTKDRKDASYQRVRANKHHT